MQEKFNQLLKNASLFTTNPDRDWRKLFSILTLVIFGLLVWSFFFYAQVQQDIAESEAQKVSGAAGGTGAQEDQLRNLIVELEAKKSKNQAVSSGSSTPAILKSTDPSR